MDVEHAPEKAVDELVAQDAHESSQHDQAGLVALDEVGERRVVRIAIGIVDRAQDVCINPSARAQAIAAHPCDR